MPIRLNLLAEAQAAEDMRRRDPVKRVAWAAALLICLMLAWSSSLQLKAMHTQREVNRAEGQINTVTNDYQRILDNQKKVDDVRHKVSALVQLATNRFSQATLLNALQQTTVEDVQLVHLRAEQSYTFVDEVKPRTNDTRVILGKPASTTEKIVLSLDGSDTSPNPGDQVTKLKEALANNSYFKEMLIRSNAINLKSLSSPAFSPATGKRGVTFAIECRLPEKSR